MTSAQVRGAPSGHVALTLRPFVGVRSSRVLLAPALWSVGAAGAASLTWKVLCHSSSPLLPVHWLRGHYLQPLGRDDARWAAVLVFYAVK